MHLFLFPDVLAHGLADHRLEDSGLVTANLFPYAQIAVVGQLNLLRHHADLVDPPIPLIRRVTAREPLKVSTLSRGNLPLRVRAIPLTTNQLQASFEGRVTLDLKQLHIRFNRAPELLRIRNNDLLHQLQPMRIQRIQPVHDIAGHAVRGRVPQRTHRVQVSHSRLRE